MRMLSIVFIAALLTSCSSRTFLMNGKKLPEVTITDIGDLYSTYKMTAQEEQQLASQVRDAAWLQEIQLNLQEANWPEAINTLQKRIEVRSTLMRYKYYKLAVVGNRTLVVVPADKNRHMPAGFVPRNNLYMFFNARSVLLKN